MTKLKNWTWLGIVLLLSIGISIALFQSSFRYFPKSGRCLCSNRDYNTNNWYCILCVVYKAFVIHDF